MNNLIFIRFYLDKLIEICPFRNSSRGTSETAVPYLPASLASSSRSGSRYTRSDVSPPVSGSRSGSRQESSTVRPRSRSRSRLDYLIIFLFTNSQNYFPVIYTNKTALSARLRLQVVEDAGIELRTVAELALTVGAANRRQVKYLELYVFVCLLGCISQYHCMKKHLKLKVLCS
jgi:hypothetical protein